MIRFIVAAVLMLFAGQAFAVDVGTYHIDEDYAFGCRHEATTRALHAFADQSDSSTFMSMLGHALDVGECVAFERGTRVFIVRPYSLRGFTEILIPGAPPAGPYWTSPLSVAPPSTN